jgi:hypothetical protein
MFVRSVVALLFVLLVLPANADIKVTTGVVPPDPSCGASATGSTSASASFSCILNGNAFLEARQHRSVSAPLGSVRVGIWYQARVDFRRKGSFCLESGYRMEPRLHAERCNRKRSFRASF